MKAIAILLFLANINFASASDYMHFLVESMDLKSIEGQLTGETLASKLYVSMDENEFHINSDIEELFSAQTQLKSGRLYFSKENLTFSTPLEEDNVLFELTKLKANSADIELGSELITIQGKSLEAETENVNFKVQDLDMSCETDGEFTSDVDIACIKNTTIKPFNSDASFISFKDLSDKSEFDIQLYSKHFSIINDRLDIETKDISGRIDDGIFRMGVGKLYCFKDPELEEMDFDRLLSGCLLSSRIEGVDFRFKDASVNAHISNINFNINSSSLVLKTNYANFRADGEETRVRGLNLECGKANFDITSVTDHLLIKGCLKRMNLNVGEMDSDSKMLLKRNKDLIDLSSIKSFKVTMNNGSFEIKGKTKLLFRIPFKLSGNVNYVEDGKVLNFNIRKAKVLGISAKSLTLYLFKKFISSRNIRVNGDHISIKL